MLNINWSTLILQIVNFMVMAFILTRFFFKPVVRILDERSKKVTSALDEAEQREREAAEMRADYEQKIAQAQDQVLSMTQQAQEELARAKQELIEQTRREIQTMQEHAASDLQESRQQAIQKHQQELGRLVTSLSARLMSEAGGSAFQQGAMERFIEQLSALPADQYRDVAEVGEGEVVQVHLVSADNPDTESLSRIQTYVEQMLGKPVEIKTRLDPSLVAGAAVRFGDVMIDGSLSGQLHRLNERYLSELEQGKV